MQPLFSPSANSQDGLQSEFRDVWHVVMTISNLLSFTFKEDTVQQPQLSFNEVHGSGWFCIQRSAHLTL